MRIETELVSVSGHRKLIGSRMGIETVLDISVSVELSSFLCGDRNWLGIFAGGQN